MALVRLYEVTGEQKYLDLSRFFIDERGTKPYYFKIESQSEAESESEGPAGRKAAEAAAEKGRGKLDDTPFYYFLIDTTNDSILCGGYYE